MQLVRQHNHAERLSNSVAQSTVVMDKLLKVFCIVLVLHETMESLFFHNFLRYLFGVM
jgi:hypothetical protein